jgi:hypothetical protein
MTALRVSSLRGAKRRGKPEIYIPAASFNLDNFFIKHEFFSDFFLFIFFYFDLLSPDGG